MFKQGCILVVISGCILACVSASAPSNYLTSEFSLEIAVNGESIGPGTGALISARLSNDAGERRRVVLGFPRTVHFRQVATNEEWSVIKHPPTHSITAVDEIRKLKPFEHTSWVMRILVPDELPPGEYEMIVDLTLEIAPWKNSQAGNVLRISSAPVRIQISHLD